MSKGILSWQLGRHFWTSRELSGLPRFRAFRPECSLGQPSIEFIRGLSSLPWPHSSNVSRVSFALAVSLQQNARPVPSYPQQFTKGRLLQVFYRRSYGTNQQQNPSFRHQRSSDQVESDKHKEKNDERPESFKSVTEQSKPNSNEGDPESIASSMSKYLHLPKMPHRPAKEELLAAANGFWERLKVRFKWMSIRSMRPWNADEWGAFVSWFMLGHIVWILVGTTTFFSLVIFSINTVFAQGKRHALHALNNKLISFRNVGQMDWGLPHTVSWSNGSI